MSDSTRPDRELPTARLLAEAHDFHTLIRLRVFAQNEGDTEVIDLINGAIAEANRRELAEGLRQAVSLGRKLEGFPDV